MRKLVERERESWVTGEGVTVCVGVGQIGRQEILLMDILQEECRSLGPQL
jgi:hypothetical protein